MTSVAIISIYELTYTVVHLQHFSKVMGIDQIFLRVFPKR